MRFTFKAETEDVLSKLPETRNHVSGIREIYCGSTTEEWEVHLVTVLGKMKTLFGEPLYLNENVEDQFGYCISATSTDGDVVYPELFTVVDLTSKLPNPSFSHSF